MQEALTEHYQNPHELVVWDTVSAPAAYFDTTYFIKKFLKNRSRSRAIILSNEKKPDIIDARDLRCDWLQKPMDDDQILASIENMVGAGSPDCSSSPGVYA